MRVQRTKRLSSYGAQRKEESSTDKRTADQLRREYPHHIPLEVAGRYLDVSPRQLSRLVAEGREPFASIGANIGTKQHYVRIYTERLIAFLNGEML